MLPMRVVTPEELPGAASLTLMDATSKVGVCPMAAQDSNAMQIDGFIPWFEVYRGLEEDTLENPEPGVRRKSVPGSKFAAFWRIFVPGSNLPLREIPTRFPSIFIPPGEPSPHPPTLAKIPSRGPPQTRATLENLAHFHTHRCPRAGDPTGSKNSGRGRGYVRLASLPVPAARSPALPTLSRSFAGGTHIPTDGTL